MVQSFFTKWFIANAWDQYGSQRDHQELMRNKLYWHHTNMRDLKEQMGRLLNSLRQASDQVQITFKESVRIEHDIIDAKIAATEEYSTLYDMMVCLEKCDIEFGIEEAIRQVLSLTMISAKMIDEGQNVTTLKTQILANMVRKYGQEKIEGLKEERKYIEFNI